MLWLIKFRFIEFLSVDFFSFGSHIWKKSGRKKIHIKDETSVHTIFEIYIESSLVFFL